MMAHYPCMRCEDESAIHIQETPTIPFSPASWMRRWLFPALTAVILLILIIVGGITSKEVKQLQFAVESNKNQLTSVSDELKQLAVIDSLNRSVATIKCSLKRIISNSSSTEGCCPPDWTAFEFNCYYFSPAFLTWNDSRDWCETQQAHLVILHSDKERDFVTNRTMPVHFWIGLSDWRTGSWEWVDQTPYTMEPRWWRPGQPDNWDGHGKGPGSEDCALFHSDGRLNDQYCAVKRRFICQKHSLNF